MLPIHKKVVKTCFMTTAKTIKTEYRVTHSLNDIIYERNVTFKSLSQRVTHQYVIENGKHCTIRVV